MAKKKKSTKNKKIKVDKSLPGLEGLKSDRPDQAFEFELGGRTFTTMPRIPAVVTMKTGVLGDEESTGSEQLEALIYMCRMLVVPSDRAALQKIIEDEGFDLERLFLLYGNLMEALSGDPLDTSSSAEGGSGKTTASSMGTWSDMVTEQPES